MSVVEVQGLVKYFGEFPALRGVTFSVEKGEIYGLIGPNGAGKTTTFRILAGLLAPSSGTVRVLGYGPGDQRVRRYVSYLPEDAGAYRNITGYEFLKMVAELYFGKGKEAEEALELGIKLSGLEERLSDKMKTYSKGMKRRIQVARALMIRPKLAILDEPTAGLDVLHSRDIRSVIRDFSRNYETTVLLASHNLLVVEGLCDKVALIDRGRILAEGSVRELIEKHGARNLEELFLKLVRGEGG
ncbi:MAG: multidrug ABC transporter ATP-binding protein [Thermoprotei archaeon]|nr:MAG: multidrug ABC transporter ATP-binding protein [Thermoprotei archaeon]